MKAFVTGAAGFVGSHLVDWLLDQGHWVLGFDNFSTGNIKFLRKALSHPNFHMLVGDIAKDRVKMIDYMPYCDTVFHLAANADIRHGIENTGKDLVVNVIGTQQVLEAARQSGIQTIVFSSTGSVYGETNVVPTPENLAFPVQKSLYSASKVAAEAFIEAYCEAFEMQSYIFRFVSLLGKRYTHGHIIDFTKSLLKDPSHLKVLGNGNQLKSYLNVSDCIDGVMTGLNKSNYDINIFNLGQSYAITVKQSIKIITEVMGVSPELIFGEEASGWIGDIPRILLDTKKIKELGWEPKYTIENSIKETVEYVLRNKDGV